MIVACLLCFSTFSVLSPKVKAESVALKTLWTYPVTDDVNFCSDVGDVDGDGYQDVAILNLHWPSGPATVQVIKSDGTPLWSISINFAGTGIALEDANLDSKDELYVFGTTGSPPHFGDPIISSYDGNGNLLWQFTVHETSPWSRCIDFVTFVNLDSDPQLEIVGIGNGWGDYTNYALDTDGTLLWKFSSRDIGSDMAVGDVNNDGVDEIVLFTFCEVYILDKNGNLIRTIQPHSGSAWSFGALGDVNGDGINDIIVAYAAYGTQEGWGVINTLYVYQSDGTLLWQKSYPLNPDGTPMNPILIDLTGDGVKDVVLLANKMVNAYRNDGTLLWTFSNFNPTRPWEIPITFFDFLKGDNKDEILFQWEQQLYILSLDGSLIQTLAIPNQGRWVSSGHIGKDPRIDNHYYKFGDINNDGINELIVDEIIDGQHYVAVTNVERPLPDFEISVSPTPNILLHVGGWNDSASLALKSINGFSGSIQLSYSGPPEANIYISFTQNPVYLTVDSQVTVGIIISSTSATLSEYTFVVAAESGSIKHELSLAIKLVGNSVAITNLVHLQQIPSTDPAFSIQQNFLIAAPNGTVVYWVQNVIVVFPLLRQWRIYSVFQIFSKPDFTNFAPLYWRSWALINVGAKLFNRRVSFPVVLNLTSYMDGNDLVVTNNGSSRFNTARYTLPEGSYIVGYTGEYHYNDAPYYSHQSPEIAIVGTNFSPKNDITGLKTADFKEGTKGVVECSVKLFGESTWRQTFNVIMHGIINWPQTGERSLHLAWFPDNTFHYAKNMNNANADQGIAFSPNYR
jgi:hypothetical protein